MTALSRKQKGNLGEAFAAKYLEGKGYRIIDRNFYAKGGELDIIAKTNDGVWVFVEVKSYKSNSPIHPLEAITPLKQRRIIRTAQVYIATRIYKEVASRFDCVVIQDGEVTHHLENCISL
ncbi:YraN family protein [bacterium]|nr:YraN family protein [bacterium]